MESNKVSKLKPFDLEKALKGEKVVTRDGREVTRLVDFPDAMFSEFLVAAVSDGCLRTYTLKGRENSGSDSSNDLFMVPKERVVWVNLYGDGEGGEAYHYTSQKDADEGGMSTRLGNRAYPITIVEE